MGARKLIINADDFGFSRGVTDAIIDCHRNGILTSTTIMVNMPAAEYAAEVVRSTPELGVGVHVNLTEGKPIAPADRIPGLLDETGSFPGNAAQSKNLWRAGHLAKQIEIEIDAQIERAISLGITPTHCDSHHGIHKLPVVRRALAKVLLRRGIPKARTPLSRHRKIPGSPLSGWIPWLKHNLRRAPSIAFHMWSHLQLRRAGIRTPNWKATRSMGVPCSGDATSEFIACISAAPVGYSEILIHPGYLGEDENPSEWHRRTWAEDTPLCQDPGVRKKIEELGLELVSFRDL